MFFPSFISPYVLQDEKKSADDGGVHPIPCELLCLSFSDSIHEVSADQIIILNRDAHHSIQVLESVKCDHLDSGTTGLVSERFTARYSIEKHIIVKSDDLVG